MQTPLCACAPRCNGQTVRMRNDLITYPALKNVYTPHMRVANSC